MIRLTHIVLVLMCLPSHAQVPVVSIPQPATFRQVFPQVTPLKARSYPWSSGDHGVTRFPGTVDLNHDQRISQQEQHKIIMQEIEEHRKIMKERQRRLQDQVYDTGLNIPPISYTLQGTPSKERAIYHRAYTEIKQMLSGGKKISLKRAVFLTEQAYNPSLDWVWFDQTISGMVDHLAALMEQHSIEKDDQVARNMMLFRFFTDTLTSRNGGGEFTTTSYPFYYDFEDFWGKLDYTKQFVSKLLQTGTGQCHSLPLLYMILAEETGAQAHLAFSPSHSYIKFQDAFGNWHNVELTNHMLISDQFLMYSGFIKSEALRNKIYLAPLSARELLGQVLMDLAGGYVKQFGYEDFVKACTNLALNTGLKSMSIHMHNHNYYRALLASIQRQYYGHGLTREQFKSDDRAGKVYEQWIGSQKHIEKLGYADMPEEHYQRWLQSVQQEGHKQEHRNRMRQLIGPLE